MQEAGPSRPTTSTRPGGPATARGLRAVHLDCVHALRVPDLSASALAANKYRSHDEQVPFSRAISTVLAVGGGGGPQCLRLERRRRWARLPWAACASFPERRGPRGEAEVPAEEVLAEAGVEAEASGPDSLVPPSSAGPE